MAPTWLMFVVLLAQAEPAAAPPPTSAQPQPATASVTPGAPPSPVDELVVTAPKGTIQAPSYDVLVGSGARAFKAEAERKQRMRRYRATSSMKDYPGIRCAIFHRC